jgi:hypothetical protein
MIGKSDDEGYQNYAVIFPLHAIMKAAMPARTSAVG